MGNQFFFWNRSKSCFLALGPASSFFAHLVALLLKKKTKCIENDNKKQETSLHVGKMEDLEDVNLEELDQWPVPVSDELSSCDHVRPKFLPPRSRYQEELVS